MDAPGAPVRVRGPREVREARRFGGARRPLRIASSSRKSAGLLRSSVNELDGLANVHVLVLESPLCGEAPEPFAALLEVLRRDPGTEPDELVPAGEQHVNGPPLPVHREDEVDLGGIDDYGLPGSPRFNPVRGKDHGLAREIVSADDASDDDSEDEEVQRRASEAVRAEGKPGSRDEQHRREKNSEQDDARALGRAAFREPPLQAKGRKRYGRPSGASRGRPSLHPGRSTARRAKQSAFGEGGSAIATDVRRVDLERELRLVLAVKCLAPDVRVSDDGRRRQRADPERSQDRRRETRSVEERWRPGNVLRDDIRGPIRPRAALPDHRDRIAVPPVVIVEPALDYAVAR